DGALPAPRSGGDAGRGVYEVQPARAPRGRAQIDAQRVRGFDAFPAQPVTPTNPAHSPPAVVRPRATSNSLSSGTSIAAIVKLNTPPITRNGASGSLDSCVIGLPMVTLVTV